MGYILCFQGLNIIGICCVLATGYICLSFHQKSIVFQVIFHFILNYLHLPIKKITYPGYF